ncbi:MAG: hypothetical protein ACI976_002325, partial [Aureispira sp.]
WGTYSKKRGFKWCRNFYDTFDKWQEQFWLKMPKENIEGQNFSVEVTNNRLETLEQDTLIFLQTT